MKRVTLLASIIVLLLSSCISEIATGLTVGNNDIVPVSITGISAETVPTKALLDQSQRVSLWEDADGISVISYGNHSVFHLSDGAGTPTGTFSGQISTISGANVYGVYPVLSSVKDNVGTVNIASYQSQTNPYDLNENDVYYATTTAAKSLETNLKLSFAPLTSLINVKIDLREYCAERIDKIKLETPGVPVSGTFDIVLSDVSKGFTPVATSDYVFVELPEEPYCSESVIVNFAIAPCNLLSGSSLRFIVFTDKSTHVFERKITCDIHSGKSYVVNIDKQTESEVSVAAIRPTLAQYVSRVTGDSEPGDGLINPKNTYTNFSLAATDYGIMWEDGTGRIFSVFGDNWTDKQFKQNWKSNTLGISSNTNLETGIKFSSFISENGSRKEIIPHTAGDNTFSMIPSAGIAVGTRQYILFSKHIMKPEPSDPDAYLSDFSEIAYSDDAGNNWIRSGVQWDGKSNFVQGSYLKQNGFIYFYGIPSGRYGNVCLARVPESKMLKKDAYRYWTGSAWSSDINAAVPITNGPTGELTVFYNNYSKRYIMMYLSINRRAIVMRQALTPQGEWSGEQIVQKDAGEGLYGPSVHPWAKDGREIYYVTSHAKSFDLSKDFWNVYLMKTSLETDENGFNMISEGGFEDYPDKDLSYRSYWYFDPVSGDRKYVSEKHIVNSGNVSVRIENPKGQWMPIFQSVAVKPNTQYILSCRGRTRFPDSRSVFLCAKNKDNSSEIAYSNPELTDSEWRRVSLEFNSGANSVINAFVNTSGWTTDTGDILYIYLDDICLRPKNQE